MFYKTRFSLAMGKLVLTPQTPSERIYAESIATNSKRLGESPQSAALTLFMHLLNNRHIDGTVMNYMISLPRNQQRIADLAREGRIDHQSAQMAIDQINRILESNINRIRMQ